MVTVLSKDLIAEWLVLSFYIIWCVGMITALYLGTLNIPEVVNESIQGEFKSRLWYWTNIRFHPDHYRSYLSGPFTRLRLMYLRTYEPAPDPKMTADEYRRTLLDILLEGEKVSLDPAFKFTIAELQDLMLGYGLKLPRAKLPDHYFYDTNYYTNRGTLELCICGAIWPCPLGRERDGNGADV